MRLIERYLFRQLLGPLVLAATALTGVAVLSQSLRGLDIIVEQGQTALLFAGLTALALPQLFNLILPVAVFVGALVSLNRLHTEQEIVVCFAGGVSRWRVISPAIRIAVFAAILALVLNLWVQPWAQRTMREILFSVQGDLVTTLVREGEFSEPSPGLTVYARQVDRDGLIHDLFVHQQKDNGGSVTYTAREGRLGKLDQTPILIMRQGSNQEFSPDGVLNYLSFDEYTFDLRGFLDRDSLVHYKISDRYLHELFFPDLTQGWEQRNRDKMLAEGHFRLSSPLYNIAFMLMALAAVIAGSFNRAGYGKRIAAVAAAASLGRIVGFAAQAACADEPLLNIVQYLIPLVMIAWAFSQLFRQRVRRFISIEHHRGARDLFGEAST